MNGRLHARAVSPLLLVASLLVQPSPSLHAQSSAPIEGVQATDAAIAPLEPGTVLTRELADGESHEYRVTLAAGLYAMVAVEQRSINVTITVFDAAGKQIADANATGIGEVEKASFIADAAGTYRVRVWSSNSKAPRGTYEIGRAHV